MKEKWTLQVPGKEGDEKVLMVLEVAGQMSVIPGEGWMAQSMSFVNNLAIGDEASEYENFLSSFSW